MNLLVILAIQTAALMLVRRRLKRLNDSISVDAKTPPKTSELQTAQRGRITARFLFEAVRDALFVTSVPIAVLCAVILLAQILGRTINGDLLAGKLLLSVFRARLVHIEPWLGAVSGLVSVLGLIIATCRTHRMMRLSEDAARLKAETAENNAPLGEEAQQVLITLQSLQQDPMEVLRNGHWEEVWRDRRVVAAREAVDRAWVDVLKQAAQAGSNPSRPWNETDQKAIGKNLCDTKRVETVVWERFVIMLTKYQTVVSQAYQRQANLAENLPPSDDPAAQKAVEKLVPGLRQTLRGMNRAVYYVCLALLIPVMLSVAGEPGLQAASISLTDLYLQRSDQIVQGREKQESTSTSSPVPLSSSDEHLISRVARQWEEHIFRQPSPSDTPPSATTHPNPDDGSDVPFKVTTEYASRSDAVRNQILIEAADEVNTPRDSQGRKTVRLSYGDLAASWDASLKNNAGSPNDNEGSGGQKRDRGNNRNGDGHFWLGNESGDMGDGAVRDQSPPRPGPRPGGWEAALSGSAAVSDTVAASSPDLAAARTVAEIYERPLTTDGPVTPIGEAAKYVLIERAKHSPQFLHNIRQMGSSLMSDMLHPVIRGDLRASSFGQMMAAICDTADHFGAGGFGGELARLVRAHIGEPRGPTVADLQDAVRIRASSLDDLDAVVRRGGSLNEAMEAVDRKVKKSADVVTPEARRMMERIAAMPVRDNLWLVEHALNTHRSPAVNNVPEEGTDLKHAEKLVEEYLEATRTRTKEDAAKRELSAEETNSEVTEVVRSTAEHDSESLVSFNDYFPAQTGADRATERGALKNKYFPDSLTEGRGGDPGGVVTPRAPELPPSPSGGGATAFERDGTAPPEAHQGWMDTLNNVAQAFSNFGGGGGEVTAFRARSFGGLRGFTRIGGVLLGRDPETGNSTAFTDLQWRWTADHRMILTLVDATGAATDSAPYKPEIILQAIRYAADGRPTTATMVSASPIPSLKILLHPTLVDTPLGAQTQQLDRLTDTYAGRAWDGVAGARREAVTQSAEAQASIYNAAWILTYAYQVREKREEGEHVSLPLGAEEAIEIGRPFLAILRRGEEEKGSDTPIPDRYHDALRDFGDSKKSPYAAHPDLYDSGLIAVLREAGKKENLTVGDLVQALSQVQVDTQKPPLQWVPWSGVREIPYHITPSDLLMLAAEPTGSAGNGYPFEFMWQVAYQVPENQTTAPWEQPELKPLLQRDVFEKATANPDDRQVLRDCREFTFLQRLCRAAFNGQLGPNFPVERINDLHRVILTADNGAYLPSYHRTLRWNSAPSLDDVKLMKSIADSQVRLSSGANDQVGALERARALDSQAQAKLLLDLYEPLQLGRDYNQSRSTARSYMDRSSRPPDDGN